MRCIWISTLAFALLVPVLARADDSASSSQADTQPASQPAAAGDTDQGGGSAIVEAGSSMEAIVFYLVGGVAALSALGCVLSVNIVRMAVCLFGTLGSVAILYFLMAANFLGAIQLIVYAGGTLIVIIFGVMLTSKSPWVKYVPRPLEIVAGAVVCLTLFGGMVRAVYRAQWGEANANPHVYAVADIGKELLTTYLVPFEVASVLLLGVMIGAAYLARPERR